MEMGVKGWAAAFGVAATACIVAYSLGLPWPALVLKLVPVAILIGWVRARAPQGAFRWRVLTGLMLSLAGDLLLGIPGVDAFVPGLVCFLLAHLAYIAAFLGDTRRGAWWQGGAAAAIAAGVWLFLTREGTLGPLLIPVTLYAATIGTMLWRALARLGLPGLRASATVAAAGAAMFVTSDASLAVQRFVWPSAGLTVLILSTYWLAQAGIAASAIRHPASTATA
jgi:alkenylglycerophosphocholine hydrolase